MTTKENESNGWIKVYRQLSDKNWWKKERFTRGQAWIDILLSVNYEDKTIILNDIEYLVPKGSFVTSQQKLADKWKWGIASVSRFLNFLKKAEQCLEYKTEHSQTHIFVLNWKKYQNEVLNLESNLERKAEKQWKGSGKVVETNKEYKERKESKEVYKTENAKRFLDLYNSIKGTSYSSTVAIESNLEYWLKRHSFDDIKQAIENSLAHKFWKDALSPEKLLRQKGTNGEPCDRIDELKNYTNDKKPLDQSQIISFRQGLVTLQFLKDKGYDTRSLEQN